MKTLKLKSYSEEDHLDYNFTEDLSYAEVILDDGSSHNDVILYNKDKVVGMYIVWCDSHDDREYLTINYTIIYLDTLTKKEDVQEEVIEYV